MLALKFRAWDKVDREMYYIDGFRMLEGKIYRCNLANNEFRDEVLETVHCVKDDLNKFILMQSTGLFDKNGTEIFEGDIVKTGEDKDNTLNLKFVNRKFGFHCVHPNDIDYYLGENTEEDCYALFEILEVFEAIGNIYENPELLEEVGDE